MDSLVSARCAILQALRLSQPSYAAALIAQVHKATEGRVALGDGSVYPLLRELERLGLIEASAAVDVTPVPERTGRPGRRYVLTEAGRLAAEAEARALLALLGIRQRPGRRAQAGGAA